MDLPRPEILRFSGFEVDLITKELRRRGRPVKLAPQALRLLEFLASQPGQLVTRDAIRQEIWSDGTFVDFEHGINKSIRQIRDALNDDAAQPRFVETIPRRGYRFIAQVEAPEIVPTTAASAETAPPSSLSELQSIDTSLPLPGPRRLSRRWLLGGAALSSLCI